MDNQSILKSLNELKQSLSEIDSAKEQVVSVTNGAKELTKAIDKYKDALSGISSSISNILEDSKNFNLETLNSWKAKAKEIQKQNDVFSANISLLKAEIDQLKEIDIKNEFQSVQESIKNLSNELDRKQTDILDKLNEISNQIDTAKVDLAKIITEQSSKTNKEITTFSIILIVLIIIGIGLNF